MVNILAAYILGHLLCITIMFISVKMANCCHIQFCIMFLIFWKEHLCIQSSSRFIEFWWCWSDKRFHETESSHWMHFVPKKSPHRLLCSLWEELRNDDCKQKQNNNRCYWFYLSYVLSLLMCGEMLSTGSQMDARSWNVTRIRITEINVHFYVRICLIIHNPF